MECVFGTRQGVETLRTKSNTHTDMNGFQQIIREYPDQNIVDSFRIVRKYHSDEDVEGYCYDWYEIDCHYRVQDKTPPLVEAQEKTNSTIGGQRVDRRYEPGELLTVDGKLYRVRLPILVGGYITPGTNVEETDIAAELSKLNLGG